MDNKLQAAKEELIRVIRSIGNPQWDTADLTYQFPPAGNKGYKMFPVFKDAAGGKVKLFPQPDSDLDASLYGLIEKENKRERFNQVHFFAKRNDYDNASIDISYNAAVDESFINTLPKSMQGKTKAWYSPA